MARSLLHIPWRMVKAVVLATLVMIILFFAATRTQVGRSELRQEIQRQFADRFDGTLTIGTLEGNLVNDLFASDIRVADPDGQTVLTIDSLIARPRWLALFSQQLTFRAVTAIAPEATLHRDSDGRWNVQKAFATALRPDSARSATSFSLADLRIVDGAVRSTRDGNAPSPVATNWLFDYTRTQLEDLDAHVTVQWQPGDELVDLFGVSATLPSHDLRLQQLQGQILGDPEHWTLNQLTAQLGSTDLSVSAELPRTAWQAMDAADTDPTSLVVDATADPVGFDELRRLMPRLPLASSARVNAQLSGPVSGLVIESLTVAHDSAEVTLEGTINGLPDQLDYQLDLTGNQLTKERLLAVAPSLPVDRLGPLGTVAFSLYGTGVIPFHSDTLDFRTATEFDVSGPTGRVAGTIDLVRRPNQPIEYTGQARADSLDLYPFIQRPAARTALTGNAQFAGRGIDRQSATGAVDVALDASTVAGRALDSLTARMQASQGQFSGGMELWHDGEGYLRADGAIDFLPSRPTYYTTASAEQLNLDWFPGDRLPTTQLTGHVEARGAGLAPESALGQLTLRVDSSSVQYADRTRLIPPHQTTLRLADRASDEPRIELAGDAATLRVRGDVAFKPLWALGNLWTRSMAAASRAEYNKPYNPPLASASAASAQLGTGSPPPVAESDVVAAWQNRARRALRTAGLPSDLTVETTFTVKRADILEALLPFVSQLRTDLEGRVAVTAGADHMTLQSHFAGNTFAAAQLSADSVMVQFDAAASLRAPLAETFSATLRASSTAARLGSVDLRAPELAMKYLHRQGTLEAESARNGSTGPFRLSSTVELLPDRNELTIREVFFKADEYAWSTTGPSIIDAYANALVVPGLQLESRHPANNQVQLVRINGTFSSAPSDTLQATAERVLLQPFSELAGMNRPLGGSLNGALAVTGGWSAPRFTSDMHVDWLTFDRRLLGRLAFATRYELGAPDLLVDASLRSVDHETPRSTVPGYMPYQPRQAEPNRINVSGRIRLDGDATSQAALADRSADALDLSLSVERADLFFFEYIFQDQITNVSGYLSGRGRIQGTFQRPRFSADLYAVDGQFDLPEFNLQYDLEGPIAVDAEGIKLNEVSVRGPDNGMASVSGAILFNEYAYFSFDLAATLQEMRIIDVAQSQDLPFYGSISASGDVTLTGPLSGATLRTTNARTTPESELFIPVKEGEIADDSGFIIFADSTGQIPDLRAVTQRENILDDRPQGEPSFLEALDLEINLLAPEGSTVNLVFDPLLGDVVTAVGVGRIQIQRQEGEFFTYGTLEVNSGEYLFTAGEVFVRRFLIDGGTITWDGDPTNAQLDLDASYRTRASTAGLAQNLQRQRIPVVIQLDITGRVASPRVELSLAIDSRDRNTSFVGEALQSLFNQPDLATDDLATEYATSVLLTNTFLLTTSAVTNNQGAAGGASDRLTDAGNQLAFNSVSQLVASQLNRYLSEALPNLDVNLGVQGEDPQDLDVIYGVALRLLDERLIIRGEGVYQGDEAQRRRAEGLEGEFVVEVRLSRNVSVEAFYRRSGDDLLNDQTLTSTTGAGLSYQTEFTTWRSFFRRLFDWFIPDSDDGAASAEALHTPSDSSASNE